MPSSPEKATFAVELEDDVSGSAKTAAEALAALKEKIDGDVKALREMQKAQRNLKGATGEGAVAATQLKDKIAAQKATIAAAQASYVRLGGTFDGVKRDVKGTTGSMSELLDVAQALPGPIGGIASKLGAAATAAGAVGLAIGAVVAITAAFIGVTIAAVSALARYGVAQANARRAELLRLEGLTTIRRWYGIAGGSAREMQDQIDRVSASVAIGRGEVAGYAEQLHRAGLRGEDASEALRLVGVVASVQGEAQARRYANLAIATARYGGSVKDLAATIDQRLGGIARRRMLDLDVQAEKLRENLGILFKDLRIEKFLEKVSELASLFSQSTASGRALKVIVEALLQPLIDGAVEGQPLVRRFFQGMVIGALRTAIAIQELRLWWRRTFGKESIVNAQTMTIAVHAGALAFRLLAASISPVATVIFSTIQLMKTLEQRFGADWPKLGRGIVDGIVSGIGGGASALVTQMANLAGTARRAFVGALEIASPSRVFAELGREIPRGVAMGVDAGAPIAMGAVESMVEPAVGGGAVTNSRSATVTIGELHVHAGSDSDARGLAEAFRDELARVLEGVRVEMGAAT